MLALLGLLAEQTNRAIGSKVEIVLKMFGNKSNNGDLRCRTLDSKQISTHKLLLSP
jgi:hypothetical protein